MKLSLLVATVAVAALQTTTLPFTEVQADLFHVPNSLSNVWGDYDHDGDGMVEYQQATPTGLANQGWKDSHDAVSHHDGRLAEGAIALCEVQGYVYAAKQAAARRRWPAAANSVAVLARITSR